MADIEEHLGVTIQQVGSDLQVPHDDFDGKVVYGQKRKAAGSNYETHTAQMAPIVASLSKLENQAQMLYVKRYLTKLARA